MILGWKICTNQRSSDMRYSKFVRVQIRFRDFSFKFASVHLSCNVRSKIQFTRNDSFYECSFGESFSEVSQTTVTQHKFLIFILRTFLRIERKNEKRIRKITKKCCSEFLSFGYSAIFWNIQGRDETDSSFVAPIFFVTS